MATWEDLDLSSLEDNDEEANLYLMEDTTLKDEDDENELLSNSSILSLGYKELKRKFSKLSKEFESLEKENINELKNKVINLRQNLAKFVNGIEILNKLLKYNKSPHDKSDLGFEKEKEIKEDKPNIYCQNYRKENLKGSSKPSKIKTKGPKKIWVPKTTIILVAYVFSNRKETLIMIPGQWVLTSYDRRRVYVQKPQAKEKRMGCLRRISKHSFLSIDKVLFVKGLKRNILSISQLCDSGYDVSFNKRECIVKDYNGSIIFSAKR
ncbi:hypothetical protein CR513_03946, partial [Mucuna pruriens]